MDEAEDFYSRSVGPLASDHDYCGDEEARGRLVALEELVHRVGIHTEVMEEHLVNRLDDEAAERDILT